MDIPLEMIKESLRGEISAYEKRRKILNKNTSGWDLGRLQRYCNYIGFWDNSVFIPGVTWDEDKGNSLDSF